MLSDGVMQIINIFDGENVSKERKSLKLRIANLN